MTKIKILPEKSSDKLLIGTESLIKFKIYAQ